MNVRFNAAGNRLLALRRRLPPVLYAVDSPNHLCQFDHPGYYNSCTMKSCCFAGDNDEYVLSGKQYRNNYNFFLYIVNKYILTCDFKVLMILIYICGKYLLRT